MTGLKKNQEKILQKLGITQLNPMQEEASLAIGVCDEVILLSPTGTGKTLAFLLPSLENLEPTCQEVQLLILVPARELAIQIEQVIREMGTGYKVNAVYGGQTISKDKLNLQRPPAILVGTPGRVADHVRRGSFSTEFLETLILDEFDKSLEIGFEEDMSEIISALGSLRKKVLTSATQNLDIPDFVNLVKPITVDYSDVEKPKLEIRIIQSPQKDKLETLHKALCHIGNQPGIIFCNFKDSIARVSDFLEEKNIGHGTFHGGMEQRERERALIKFRNGTHQLLVATDLAARGIDIPELKFILHYHLPMREHEFVHRNGRTARMKAEGTVFILKWIEDELPEFISDVRDENLVENTAPSESEWSTLFISGGRKDKISKGDIAGLFFKQAELQKDQLGVIELKSDCAFVAVKTSVLDKLIPMVNNKRLKKKKVRVHLI